MRFVPTPLDGAFLIEPAPIHDVRGFFARTICRDEFANHGLNADFIQSSISWNRHRKTLRGMHMQRPPYAEDKLIRCTAGSIYDVIVDMRLGSPTHRCWYGVELSAHNHRSLYVPKGFAHGFVALVDEAEVLYQMTARFVPAAATGFRWNDPKVGIDWMVADPILSDRDATYPDLP